MAQKMNWAKVAFQHKIRMHGIQVHEDLVRRRHKPGGKPSTVTVKVKSPPARAAASVFITPCMRRKARKVRVLEASSRRINRHNQLTNSVVRTAPGPKGVRKPTSVAKGTGKRASPVAKNVRKIDKSSKSFRIRAREKAARLKCFREDLQKASEKLAIESPEYAEKVRKVQARQTERIRDVVVEVRQPRKHLMVTMKGRFAPK